MLGVGTQLHVGHPHTFSTLTLSPCIQLGKMFWLWLPCRLFHVTPMTDWRKSYYMVKCPWFSVSTPRISGEVHPCSLKGICTLQSTFKALELCGACPLHLSKDKEPTAAVKTLLAVFAFHIVQTGGIRQEFALQSLLLSFTLVLFIPEKS